jgi:hypothetical protein
MAVGMSLDRYGSSLNGRLAVYTSSSFLGDDESLDISEKEECAVLRTDPHRASPVDELMKGFEAVYLTCRSTRYRSCRLETHGDAESSDIPDTFTQRCGEHPTGAD